MTHPHIKFGAGQPMRSWESQINEHLADQL